jgi:sugar phosphate isomerase/epimerase
MQKFILSGFADEMSDDFEEQMNGMEKLGIRYIELRSIDGEFSTYFSKERTRDIKSRMDARGLKVSALSSRIGKYRIRDPFEPHLEEFRHALELAKILDTKYIRLFSFFIDKGDNPYDFTDEVLRRLSAFKDEAKGSGIILLHENEKLIYGDVPERCKIIAEELYSPEFRLIFDPSNFIECEAETYPHAFNMLADYIEYMHIKDCRKSDKIVVPSGMGDGHIKEILAELKKRNYSGFLSLEPHLADYIGVGYDKNGTPKAGPKEFALAHNALLEILKTL